MMVAPVTGVPFTAMVSCAGLVVGFLTLVRMVLLPGGRLAQNRPEPTSESGLASLRLEPVLYEYGPKGLRPCGSNWEPGSMFQEPVFGASGFADGFVGGAIHSALTIRPFSEPHTTPRSRWRR